MREQIENPRDVPEAQALIVRLCELQALVAREVTGYATPTDCFCGEQGFWPLADQTDFKNSGEAVGFIEMVVLAAIAERRRPGHSPHHA